MSIMNALEEIVGKDRVSASDPVCLSYAYNPFFGKDIVIKPDIVVMPESVDQISKIILAANQYKVPISTKGAVGGGGLGGAYYGGILLDLALLDKILLIDKVNMKAVAEAGCSFFKLTQEVFKSGMFLPTAAYGPGPSVAASALTPANGFGESRYGANINLVEGFEVILPSGEVIRVGSMAYFDSKLGPYYRYTTGPDLVGLFTKSNGALGIVTKVAYRCMPKPDYWSFTCYTWPLEKITEATRALRNVVAAEVFNVHLVDRARLRRNNMLPPNGDIVLMFIIDGKNKQELAGHEQIVKDICDAEAGIHVPGQSEDWYTNWPTDFFPLGHKPSFPLPAKRPRRHTYIFDEEMYPISWFPECYAKRKELCQKYGIWEAAAYDGFVMSPQMISAQTTIGLDDSNPDVVTRFHKCRDEFRDWYGQIGGTFQYRLPPLVPDYVWTNQSGAFKLMKTIKAALDPNNILSPGSFEIGKGNERT